MTPKKRLGPPLTRSSSSRSARSDRASGRGAYYDQQRARGHRHQAALRAVAAKWVKIIFVLWSRQIAYDENHHLAMMTRQRLRQGQAAA